MIAKEWNVAKKLCWLPLSVDGVLLTAVCQTVCTLASCFNSSLSVGGEDFVHAWHHSFSGANRANIQQHRGGEKNQLQIIIYADRTNIFFHEAIASWSVKRLACDVWCGNVRREQSWQYNKGERKTERHMKRRKETGRLCCLSRRLFSLTRLYQQDGHLISLHSGTTTSVSINDKSYWQLLPDRRGVMIEEGMWSCWKIDWN